MRYVNRRRLLIVVVLAALFGSALPYGMWVSTHVFGFVEGFPVGEFRDFEHGNVTGFRQQGWIQESVLTSSSAGILTPEDWKWMVSECDGLVPADMRDSPPSSVDSLSVVQYGWPFRAVCMCFPTNSATGKVMDSSTAWNRGSIGWAWLNARAPSFIPLGVRWGGVVGNISASVLFFAAPYCGLAHWRARRRIKRGKCWKCGYLSKGAAVCPECGAIA